MTRFWTRTFAIATAYYLAGQLGLLLAIPPAFSSAVWPAAGVALGAVLVWGWGVLPAIFIGSFFTEFTVWVIHPNAPNLLLAVFLSALLATGVIAQTALGGWLVRRVVGFPSALDEARDIALFLGLGGPVACLVSSGLATMVLCTTGWIPSASAPSAALRWWVGDSIGVLTVAPLMLVAFAQPRQVWRSRVFSVAVPMLLTSAVAIVAFLGASKYEDAQSRSEFQDFAHQQFDSIREELELAGEIVQSVASYLEVSDGVDAQSFREFVTRSLQSNRSIRALAWSPRLDERDRETFEQEASWFGQTSYRVKEFSNPNSAELRPARGRAEYFPLQFVESSSNGKSLLGLDLASEETRRRALQRAMDSGEVTFTAPLNLAHDAGIGVLAVVPVYHLGSVPRSVFERRQSLRGFALGALRVRGLIEEATRPEHRSNIFMDIVDVTDPRHPALLFSDDRPPVKSANPIKLDTMMSFAVGDRRWLLRARAKESYLENLSTWHTWAVFAIGLLFSGLLGALLLIVTGRTVSTERVVTRRTAELEERERRFRDLLEAMPDAVVILKEAREIILVNAQAKSTFGYSSEELVGKDIEVLVPDRFKEQFRQHHLAYLENSAERTRAGFEFMVRRKDDVEFPAEITLNPLQSPGGFLVAVAIRDVSMRKRLEEEVRQSQKMEAIGTLASGVAHDFNNLLMGVSGCTSIALGLLTNDNPARVYLNEIKLSCESGAAITRQLLAFSRKRDVQPRPVDLNEVVQNSTNMLKRLLGENIELTVRLDAVGARTIVDPGQLEQILMNLVVNAHDAMPWGGRLSIDTGVVLLRDGNRKGLPGGAYVALTVADTGHGMTEETRQRIFEPFFTTKPVGKGTGLGLSTVHAVITQAGGHISVQSRPGEGAMFRALLPAAPSM